MDQAYLDIINQNLFLIAESSPQRINKYQFVDADNRSILEVNDLIADMVNLDFIELGDDDGDDNYYLTENGYDCVEAGGCRVPVPKAQPEEVPFKLFADTFETRRSFTLFVYGILIAGAIVATMYGSFIGLTDEQRHIRAQERHLLDSLKKDSIRNAAIEVIED